MNGSLRAMLAAAGLAAIASPAFAQHTQVRVDVYDHGVIDTRTIENNLQYDYMLNNNNGSVTMTAAENPSTKLTSTTPGGTGMAYADLSTGKVGAYLNSNADGVVMVWTEATDGLRFHIAGADDATVTPLHMLVSLHIADPSAEFSTVNFGFGLGAASVQWLFGVDWSTIQLQTPGWDAFSYSFNEARDTVTFDTILNVRGADPLLPVGIGFSAGVGYGGALDISHTAGIKFDLQRGVTFESLSGEFLTATTSAAPEPASWAMMLAGFGLTGGLLRRRRSLAAA